FFGRKMQQPSSQKGRGSAKGPLRTTCLQSTAQDSSACIFFYQRINRRAIPRITEKLRRRSKGSIRWACTSSSSRNPRNGAAESAESKKNPFWWRLVSELQTLRTTSGATAGDAMSRTGYDPICAPSRAVEG